MIDGAAGPLLSAKPNPQKLVSAWHNSLSAKGHALRWLHLCTRAIFPQTPPHPRTHMAPFKCILLALVLATLANVALAQPPANADVVVKVGGGTGGGGSDGDGSGVTPAASAPVQEPATTTTSATTTTPAPPPAAPVAPPVPWALLATLSSSPSRASRLSPRRTSPGSLASAPSRPQP